MKRYGNSALVTGASSGIGKVFAQQLAAAGIDLVLVARRKDRLQALANELEEKHEIAASSLAVDLSEPNAIPNLKQQLDEQGVSIDILINNTGYGGFGLNGRESELGMVDLNCRAVADLTLSFLPTMKENKRGAIILVSSLGALAPTPYLATYSATKAFDLVLGEALHSELQGAGIDVLTVLPGATSTEFMGVAHMNLPNMFHMPFRTPENVVKTAFETCGKKSFVIDGPINKSMVVMAKFLPRGALVAINKMILKPSVG